MSAPEIAVVIPTRDREARLAFALEALADQTLEPDRFEVVVVRAGDAPDGPRAAAPDGLRVRFLACPGPGSPAAQRNHGWRATSAPLVAFTDDDCRPAPEWLERLLEAAARPDLFLQGRTEPDPAERHLLHGFARSMEVTGPDVWYPTCNMAYPSELLERLGGFDEAFTFSWGEDTDLALRAREAGAERLYVDGALVWHAVLARPLPQALREAARRDSIPMVLSRHPAQRRAIYRGIFVRRSHARLLLAVCGLLALRRAPALRAAALVQYWAMYVDWEHVGPRMLLRLALHLPARTSVDLVDLAATLRSAIRHRVLVI